jgi:hypothetical protein
MRSQNGWTTSTRGSGIEIAGFVDFSVCTRDIGWMNTEDVANFGKVLTSLVHLEDASFLGWSNDSHQPEDVL